MSIETRVPTYADKLSTANGPGNTDPPKVASVNANLLRRLAEKADGLRDEHPYLVRLATGEIDVRTAREIRGDEEVLLDLHTENSGPGLTLKPAIRLMIDGKPYGAGTELDKADAVFTSQSAIEKFVLPYYQRFSTPDQLNEIAKKLFGDRSVAAGHHLPGSSYGTDKIHAVTLDSGVPKFIEFSVR